MAEQDSTNPPPAPTEPTTADAGQAKANTTDLSNSKINGAVPKEKYKVNSKNCLFLKS